jgi:hypothetical protein
MSEPNETCPRCGSEIRGIRIRRLCTMTAPPEGWKWVKDKILTATDFVECDDPWHAERDTAVAPPASTPKCLVCGRTKSEHNGYVWHNFASNETSNSAAAPPQKGEQDVGTHNDHPSADRTDCGSAGDMQTAVAQPQKGAQFGYLEPDDPPAAEPTAEIEAIIKLHETSYRHVPDKGFWQWECRCGEATIFADRDGCVINTRKHWAELIVRAQIARYKERFGELNDEK